MCAKVFETSVSVESGFCCAVNGKRYTCAFLALNVRSIPQSSAAIFMLDEVAICGPRGAELLPPGEEGEVVVRGPAVFAGYELRVGVTGERAEYSPSVSPLPDPRSISVT